MMRIGCNARRLNITGESRIMLVVMVLLTWMPLTGQIVKSAPFPILSQHADYTEQLLKDLSWSQGDTYVQAMATKIDNLDDYVFDSSLTALKEGEESQDLGRMYYKKNNLVRLEAKSGKINKGSTVVRRKDGKIRAAGGGVLKFVKMTLDEDSRLLQLPNGYNAIKSDLSSLLTPLCQQLAKHSIVSRVSSGTVSGQKWSTSVKIVELKDSFTGERLHLIFVDPQTEIPLEWDVYRGGKLISITTFDNFRANQGLEERLFDI